MTNQRQNPAVRRAARALALTPAIAVTLLTSTAFAEAPQQWEDSPRVSTLHAILLLGGVPVGLFLLITLLVYIPSMRSGESYSPGQPWRSEPEWFGGPREGIEASDAGSGAEPTAVGTGDESSRGGTSGRW